MLVVVARGEGFPDFPIEHHLAAQVRIRLEQDRIHVRRRLQSARLGLNYLGPADLSAAGTGIGIVGHVLRFEGSYADAAAPQPGADRRRHPALAGLRRCSANEDRLRVHHARDHLPPVSDGSRKLASTPALSSRSRPISQSKSESRFKYRSTLGCTAIPS